MDIEITDQSYQPFEEKMKMTIKVLEDTFNGIRAGRANPRLLDTISVPIMVWIRPCSRSPMFRFLRRV